ncbi:MAG: ankyrin repeat domain-containing protein [Alphaproteobacteria bacterium]|nr:ankyrin repeat domain-containing protein [Alphaproteobacteria bacterium]
MMKCIRIFALALFLIPAGAMAAGNDFMVAAQLLSAARNADIQQVQILVNNGADVNFVDSTGLSVVCTALMNNDVRAAQILQMYGADASKCDQQIKQYNRKNKTKERSGGLFSGLSSAHTLTLAAAGAAVVVGGLLLLTDVFDSGSGNSSGGGGDRPNNGGDSGNNGGNATAQITLPYGPSMPNAESESANYSSNLNYYSPSIDGVIKDTFELMTKSRQNYLLMMHGYSPLARGYMGMRTLRGTGNVPVDATTLGKINVKGLTVGGGRPVGVALVTANGVNASAKPVGTETAQKNSLDDELLAWTTISGNVVNEKPEISNLSSKYYNNLIVLGGDGAELTNSYTVEDKAFVSDFDLSGLGTAVNNMAASDADDMLAKVVGGANSGYAAADYIGFMPNGQMGIFRTGDGRGMKAVSGEAATGTYTMAGTALAVGDKINLFGKEMTVSSVTGSYFEAQDTGIGTYKGYIGANGYLYITSTLGGDIDQAYSMTGGVLTQVGELGDIDYYNYKALLKSGAMWAAGDLAGGRSRMDIIANASVIEPMHSRTTKTIDDLIANLSAEAFAVYVNSYYDRNTTDGPGGTNALPATDAVTFFNSLGSTFSPLVIFSTGASETDSAWSDAAQVATFENAAPLVFSNLEHLFMSVVAIGMTGTGTSGATSVAGYTPANKFAIAQWTDTNGTDDITTDDKYYKARVCGIAGRGANGIDPWCFAATGVTDELAVSSAAGAAGAVKSAFSYLSNKELFTLLALTADGPYLGSLTDGSPLTKDALRAYLQSMYQMPAEYQYRWEKGNEEYLDVFKEVFGYGLINLERATKPGSSIYYYDAASGKIVSGSGDAYWRSASKTAFRASSAFSPRVASISAPFFDILESADGELRLPRIWENEFSIGAGRRRGLYLNDVFGDLKTRDASVADMQIGGLHFSMTSSERPYADNMGGLDSMRLGMRHGNWDIAAEYQHNFTDGAGLFSGMANPIMALAHDALLSDVRYDLGRWSFGARAFSGAITDSELMESDPTITAQYTPARLGLMHGGAFGAGWRGERFGLNADIGIARETETVLGALTGGLLNLGGGDTSYVDVHGRYTLMDNVSLNARATFARTTADASGQYVMGISDIYSNAFAIGVDMGNFEFTLSQPLAARGGHLKYAYADYDTVEGGDGRFDIAVGDMGVRSAALRPARRENRFSATYRHSFGEFTDGAVGFIYRMNPNNTDEFGDESVFMLKLSHRLGI